MKYIKLSSGHRVKVDDHDFPELSKHKWQGNTIGGDRDYRHVRARRHLPGDGSIYMHNQILGKKKGFVVDHINRNGLDNRRQNLRFISQKENMQNRTKGRGHSSKYKGVSWDECAGKWKAYIRIQGKLKAIGRYASERLAAKAYDVAARSAFGCMAVLNFKKIPE
jgi:hypothetical protein